MKTITLINRPTPEVKSKSYVPWPSTLPASFKLMPDNPEDKDVRGTNGKIYCSPNCAAVYGSKVLHYLNPAEYRLMRMNSNTDPGPRCICGDMFHSWF